MEAEDERKRRHKKDRHRENEGKRSKRDRSRSPEVDDDRNSRRKRKHSRSASPDSRDRNTRKDKPNEAQNESQVKTEPPERKRKETDMLNTRTGGAYIPPARLRMMQAQITDKSSMAFQRLAWEALKKSIHGHINKINIGNIGIIIKELLKENIVRGRGLLCRSIIQAQAASPTFTNVYAALVSAVNSRFPNIGELLLKRLVIQFKRGFKRNDKAICISAASFIAHLVNQRVAHEILALELLTLLVESPTDDSVEVAIAFLKECGQKLTEVSSKGVNAIFEMLRNILHEGHLDKRVQYMIEVMFQVWKDGFKDHPALIEELELVPEEEQFTHLMMLDEATDGQDILNVFKHDEKYEENEEKYKKLCKEILGSDAESGDEEGSGSEGDSEEEEDEENEEKPVTIIDNTETNLVALRRTIYLTINSSLDFEECAHKLMKMQLKPGQEIELCHMFLDCCAEQRTYEKFYGLLAQRFCNINRVYIDPFEEIFKESYSTAHRLDMNRLRNVSKFFAHLLFTDSISWEVLECVKLNEEDTTSSSRIYIKILFQELAEYLGMKKLNDRLKDQTLQGAFSGLFPRDNPKNSRFSINFFTSIGLGGLTDELREHLKQMPKNIPPPDTEIKVASSSSESSSSSSDSSSSDSSSSDDGDDEDDAKMNKKKQKKKSKENKDKTPKTPEPEKKDNDRWGHNGFFETYGKDARRHESRNDEQDEFVRPRDVRRNDNRRRNDDDDDRNSRNDRRFDRENDERRGYRSDERISRDSLRLDRDSERRGRDDSRKDRDDSRKGRDDIRKECDDSRKDRDESRKERDDDSRKNVSERRGRDDSRKERDDSKKERDDSRKGRDESRKELDDIRKERDDDSRKNDSERRGRDDSRKERDESRKNRDRKGDSDRNDRENDRRGRDNEKRAADDAKTDGRDHDNDYYRKIRGSDSDGKGRHNDRSRREEKRTDREDNDSMRNRDRKQRDSDRNDRENDKRCHDIDKTATDDAKNDRRDRDNDRKGRDTERRKREEKTDREELKKSRDIDRNDDKRGREKKERSHDTYEKREDKRRHKSEEIERTKDKESHRKSTKNIKKESESESETDSSSSESEEERYRSEKRKDKDDGWDIRGSSIRRESPPRYWAVNK